MPFQEGQDVKTGDTLVTIDPTTYQAKLESGEGPKGASESRNLQNAKTNLWRDQELLKHEFVSQKQTDQDTMYVGQYPATIARVRCGN